MLKSSKSSVEFTTKFLDHAFKEANAKESVETMSLKLRKQDGDVSGAGKAAENEALTGALVDMVTDDLLPEDREANDLSELKDYFSKWKF